MCIKYVSFHHCTCTHTCDGMCHTMTIYTHTFPSKTTLQLQDNLHTTVSTKLQENISLTANMAPLRKHILMAAMYQYGTPTHISNHAITMELSHSANGVPLSSTSVSSLLLVDMWKHLSKLSITMWKCLVHLCILLAF